MITSSNIRSTIHDEGLVLLDLSNGKVFNANGVGSRIWLQLQDGKAAEEIADSIAKEFHITRDQATLDVLAFIDQLKANRIIEQLER